MLSNQSRSDDLDVHHLSAASRYFSESSMESLACVPKARENAISGFAIASRSKLAPNAERLIAENKKQSAQREEVQKALRDGRAFAEQMRRDLLIENAKEEAQRMLSRLAPKSSAIHHTRFASFAPRSPILQLWLHPNCWMRT